MTTDEQTKAIWDEVMLSNLDDRQEGEMTRNELKELYGVSYDRVKQAMDRAVASGKVEQRYGYIAGNRTVLYKLVK